MSAGPDRPGAPFPLQWAGSDARLLILGGGPAGLAAALAARQRGLCPVVVEAQPGIIDKACGEGLMPPAVRALAALGVGPLPGLPFTGIAYVDARAPERLRVERDFPHGPGLGVRRLALSAALRAAVAEAQVPLIEARAVGISQDDDGVELELEGGGRLRAPHLLAADGLRSPTRRWLGLERPARGPARVGLRQHFLTPPWSPRVEVHWAEGVECYITPVAEDTVGVAFLMDRSRYVPLAAPSPIQAALARFPHIAARLGPPASSPRGAGPFEQRVSAPRSGRVLLIGDAAGYLDPLTGEGIRLGLDTGAAAVAAVAAGRLGDYDRAYPGLLRRYWWMTGGLLAVTRPPLLRRMLLPTVQRAPWLLSLALRLMGGG